MTDYTAPVVGVFADRSQAREAIRELRDAGFLESQIGLIARDVTEAQEAATLAEDGSQWEEGAIAGGLTGAGIGGLWALGIAAGALPAIGPIIAGGLLASVLASAAGGAAVGGLLGALIGLGIPEEEAQHYEGEFKSGRTLVTVRSEGRSEEAASILGRNGASVRTMDTTPVTSGLAGPHFPSSTDGRGNVEGQTAGTGRRTTGSPETQGRY